MPQHYADQPITPASVSAVDGVNVSEGCARSLVNNAQRAAVAMVKADFAGDAGTITASSTFTLASISTGDYIKMAAPAGGSISSFGPASDGLTKLLECLGTTVLRNGASLSVQGGADLTTVAGDLLWMRRSASVWKARVIPAAPVLAGAANTFTAAQAVTVTAAGTALTLTSTDAGAGAGPNITFDRNSASPAVNDIIGGSDFRGRDSGGNSTSYGLIRGIILDPTDTSEDGRFEIVTMQAGTAAGRVEIEAGMYMAGTTGTDKGAGTFNASGLYVGGHGTVAQVVRDSSATYTTLGTILPFDDTIPQNTEGDEILTVAITPVNASSTLKIEVILPVVGGAAAAQVSAALFVDTTAGALAAGSASIPGTASGVPVSFTHLVSAGSTSARTYKVRAGSSVATDGKLNGDSAARVFGGVMAATLIVTEILPQ